ncbi:MAG TPA: 2Fe-2S iron-sulfur cluster-binding protein [Steroidobacteraceae bacterium]|nr:2Fe-2S iron-sulfur cluster-binding protein [Steroidobacteraceae bacterium]
MRVSLSNSDRSFSAAPGRPLLDAALDAGLNLPHSCQGGSCGACRARLLEGEITYPNGRPLGLSDAETAGGFILLCQARAASDLRIEAFEWSAPGSSPIKRLPGRIVRLGRLSHDVLGVFLRLPAAEEFNFQPGQYIDVILPAGRRRSFSIASPPHDSSLLELHVRRVPGGEFTEALFAGSDARSEHDGRRERGMLLSIEGPLGQFVYRPAEAPMLLVGGGTGLAPLKSMLRHVIENHLPRRMTLYWGVRSERDLYAHDELEELARRAPALRYEAVLSEAGAAWAGRRGLVHEAVLQDFESLAATDIYASGPPALIAAVREEFTRRGADPERLYSDSFDYASDRLERQRTTAASKS